MVDINHTAAHLVHLVGIADMLDLKTISHTIQQSLQTHHTLLQMVLSLSTSFHHLNKVKEAKEAKEVSQDISLSQTMPAMMICIRHLNGQMQRKDQQACPLIPVQVHLNNKEEVILVQGHRNLLHHHMIVL
jgi:hypothetical protein